MAGALRTVTQGDFSGGVNVAASPYLVTAKQVVRVRNMHLDEHGSLRTRDGFAVLTTSPDRANPIVYRNVLTKTTGATFPYAFQNNGTTNTLYNTTAEPWGVVGTTGTNYPTPQAVTVADREFFALGYETPQTWDGTTFTPITAGAGNSLPRGAKHCAFHLGSLWIWNTAQNTTTYDGPSSLRMSDPATATGQAFNSWPNANQTFIAKDDGQQGMGMAQFTIVETGISPTATLVCFKTYSGYQVTGVLSSSTYTVQKIKSDMGCVAPRSIQFCSGFGIIRLSHRGFALYNGVDDKLISEEIRPYIFGERGQEFIPINFAAVDRAWAAQSQNPPIYVCAVPIAGNALTRIFVYDLVRRAWAVDDFPVAFQTLQLVTFPGQQPEVQGGTTDGRLVRIYGNDADDNGQAIQWSMRTKPSFLGTPYRPTFWRRVVIDLLFTPSQTATVRATAAGLGAQTSRVLTFTGTPAGDQWGSGIWGTMVWSATGNVESRRSLDVLRTAPSAYIDLSGSGPVTLRGIEWQGRTKPLTRMAS